MPVVSGDAPAMSTLTAPNATQATATPTTVISMTIPPYPSPNTDAKRLPAPIVRPSAKNVILTTAT